VYVCQVNKWPIIGDNMIKQLKSQLNEKTSRALKQFGQVTKAAAGVRLNRGESICNLCVVMICVGDTSDGIV